MCSANVIIHEEILLIRVNGEINFNKRLNLFKYYFRNTFYEHNNAENFMQPDNEFYVNGRFANKKALTI